MTQNYQSILPVMFAVVIAQVLVSTFSKTSLLTEQLRRSGVLINHDYEADLLNMIPVASVMTQDAAVISSSMTVSALMDRINAHDPEVTRHQAIIMVDDSGDLQGILTRGDLITAIENEQTDQPVLAVGNTNLVVTYPQESVHEAMARMLQNNGGRLPVVDPKAPRCLVGYLSRASVIEAHLKQIQADHDIESGWLQRSLDARRNA